MEKSSTFKVHECIGLWAGHSSSRRTGPYNQNSIPHHLLIAIEFGKGKKKYLL